MKAIKEAGSGSRTDWRYRKGVKREEPRQTALLSHSVGYMEVVIKFPTTGNYKATSKVSKF